jgi:formate hydrogenlyase subunit 3/multisubunit Na+/H+ antiporter MnhD subunit
MAPAHIHLLINHLPIIGSFLCLPVLLVVMLRRKETATMLAAAILLSVVGIGAVGALRTGEPAEEQVEDLPGVSEPWIGEHEERAETATIFAVVTALAGLGVLGLSMRQKETPLWASGVLLLGSTLTAATMAWTGSAGGPIRHSEIRSDYGDVAQTSEAGERGEHGEAEEHEGREHGEGHER